MAKAKLYWRIKKNGKWTWQPCHVEEEFDFKYEDGSLKTRYVVEALE